MPESTLWIGRPSQVINLGTFLSCFLVVTIPYAFWKFLEIKATEYKLTQSRLITRWGILNRKSDEIELYRVKDYQIVEPVSLRLFGLANLILITSDKSSPVFTIKAISNAETLKNLIRNRVEVLRKEKGVREID